MRDLRIALEQFASPNVLEVLYALYGLTIPDSDLYVTVEDIAAAGS